jgi:hypothetical protein
LDEFAVLAAALAAEDATEPAFVVVVGANNELTDIFIPSVTYYIYILYGNI